MNVTRRAATRGFTLIELMIVIAIIALLAAIALPAYNAYRIRSAEAACQAEMKSYASLALAVLHIQGTPSAPPLRACATATTAVDFATNITGTPQPPGVRVTTCDIQTSNCSLP